ncbi:hypothetical protein [uncultured Chryseobacterium sp.]|nr:hypothetical protein [uncultured Chryseobacterium sp.]
MYKRNHKNDENPFRPGFSKAVCLQLAGHRNNHIKITGSGTTTGQH